MSDIDQVILELKCLGEVAEVEGMTVEGNALHPIINMGWQSLDRLRAEVASLKEERDRAIRQNDIDWVRRQEITRLTQQLAAANGKVEMLRDAIENLRKVKGRHNTELACNRLFAALSNLNEDSAG